MNDDEAKETQVGEEKFSSDLYIDDPDHPENQFYSPEEKVADYHYWLGRFVTVFADTEAVLRSKCAQATDIQPDMAGIVFGEVTVRSGGDLLKRLLDARGLSFDEDLDRALKQFYRIAETRNAILHKGVDLQDLKFATKTGLPNSRRRQYAVSVPVLEAMTSDLNVIFAAIIVSIPTDDSFKIWGEGVRNLAREPWQYTHAPLPRPTERR